jgi:hypothetical protein
MGTSVCHTRKYDEAYLQNDWRRSDSQYHAQRHGSQAMSLSPSLSPTSQFIASVVIVYAAITSSANAQNAPKTEELVGRWGVAAYWNDADASKVTAQAKSFCSQPYVISRGANGGAMMFEPFDGKPKEIRVQSGQIVAADGSGSRTTKTITSWNGSTLVFNYIDEEAKRKYGNMVFVRCGR